MLTLTDSAAAKLLELLAEHEPEESVLRLYVKPGGCTGFSYGMALDTPQPTDQRLTLKGVPIAIDQDSVELLAGSELDYVDDVTGRGFRIHNPNAVSTCGCGTSFRTATQAGQPGSCE